MHRGAHQHVQGNVACVLEAVPRRALQDQHGNEARLHSGHGGPDDLAVAREATQAAAAEAVRETVRENKREAVREAVREQVRETTQEALRETVREATREAVRETVREATREAVGAVGDHGTVTRRFDEGLVS